MKLIVLERDGVISHHSEAGIRSPQEWQPLPGSVEAIARLCRAGYRIVVATCHEAPARGLVDLATMGAIHAKMHQAVASAGGRIDAIFFCPHGPEANCACRKPRPGLFVEILQRFKASPAEVRAIGHQLRDLQAAHEAGCRPMLVLTGAGRATLSGGGLPPDTAVRVDLAAVAAELAP